MPITGFLFLGVLHWNQLASLVGVGPEPAQFGLQLKGHPLASWYLVAVIGAAAFLNALPYLEELLRCIRAQKSVDFAGRA